MTDRRHQQACSSTSDLMLEHLRHNARIVMIQMADRLVQKEHGAYEGEEGVEL